MAARARDLAFFCTYDADGAATALEELAELCGRRPKAVLAVPAHALVSGAFHAELQRFVGAAMSLQYHDLITQGDDVSRLKAQSSPHVIFSRVELLHFPE